MNTKKLLELKYLFSIFTICDLFFIFYLSFEKFNFKKTDLYQISTFFFEFFAHIIFYLSLSVFLYFSLKVDWKIKSPISIVILISFTVSLLIELVQGIFLDYRSFQLIDIFANITGVFFFYIFSKNLSFFLNK